MWNLALDENSGPQNGGCANCRGVVTIERSTGNVTYNGEYYALGHASLAARPGAVRIESSQIAGLVDTVAFLNPDGSKGLLVLNERREPTRIEVHWAGQAFAYELPAQAVATFTWP
jgi:glucosylceramidase